MTPLPLFFLVFLIFLLKWMFSHQQRLKRLPPGPFPFPFIGNLPQLGLLTYKYGDIVDALEHFKKEYGPVFTIWMGPQPTVHIGSMKISQETMVKRGGEFVDRWFPFLFSFGGSKYGIATTSGPIWHEQRRFALHTLRKFGMGKNIMEDRIMAEFNLRAEQLDIDLQREAGVDSEKFFDLMVGSIINRILFSERLLEHHEKQFFEQLGHLARFNISYSPSDFLVTSVLPLMIPILNRRWANLAEPPVKIREFLKRKVDERMEAIKRGEHVIPEEPEDYADAFLLKMKEEYGNPDSSFCVESMVLNLIDLWIAGQSTTVPTIMHGFAQLLNHPKVLDKVRKELLKVTGGGPLSLKDKSNTPYFNATIMEIQRVASLMNINFFRAHSGDTTIGGHPVADGTPITAEISLIMRDEMYFKNPKEFNPSRFIENPVLEQHVIPFGIGKRACPGEALARAELYLIFGNMILRYDFKVDSGKAPTNPINSFGIFRMPEVFKMKFSRIR